MKVDFLTVHFGDVRWTRLQLDTIASQQPCPGMSLGEAVVVDNARDETLRPAIQGTAKVRVLTFPEDVEQCRKFGHDHAASLKRGLESCQADTVVILDCDAHLVASNFFGYLSEKLDAESFDAIAASDPRFESQGLSHPCFLALGAKARQVELPWDPDLPGNESQTARRARQVLTDAGLSVHVPKRRRCFDGVLGDLYDDQVYHHGSATFSDSSDPRLRNQVHPCAGLFSGAVLRHRRYHLTRPEKWIASAKYRWSRYRSP